MMIAELVQYGLVQTDVEYVKKETEEFDSG